MTELQFISNLKTITGASPVHLKNIINNGIDVIVHEIACQCSEKTDGKAKEFEMQVPYIGLIEFTIGSNNVVYDIRITPNNDLQNKLNGAVSEFKSPLIEKASTKVGSQILEKYKSLL